MVFMVGWLGVGGGRCSLSGLWQDGPPLNPRDTPRVSDIRLNDLSLFPHIQDTEEVSWPFFVSLPIKKTEMSCPLSLFHLLCVKKQLEPTLVNFVKCLEK